MISLILVLEYKLNSNKFGYTTCGAFTKRESNRMKIY